MRVRTTVTAISALGMLTMLAACGGQVSAAVSIPAETGANHQPGVAPAGPVTTNAAPGTLAAAGPASFTAQFVVQRQDVAMIMLTNTSGHAVTVQGSPALSFTNAADQTLSVPTRQVDVPGPAVSINVVPGGSVFAPVEWTQGDKGDAATLVADGVQVVPPSAGTPVSTKFVGVDGSTPGYYEFDMKSVEIGTFQASTQNLLSF